MCPIGKGWEVVAKVRGKGDRKRLVDAFLERREKGLKKRAVRGSRRKKAIAKGTGKLERRKYRSAAPAPASR